MKNLKKIFYY